MSVNNGVITAPIGIGDVNSVLNAGSLDLGTLCNSAKINPWARFKPTNGGQVANRKKSNANEKYSVIYGIAQYSGTTLVGRSNILKRITSANFMNDLKWSLAQPTLNYYRLTDFNGYNHNAKFGFDNADYKYFPANSYGVQTGSFYNMYYPILQLISSRPSGLTFTPIQCWEDATSGMSLSSYSTLYLEDMIYAANQDNIATFNIATFKLGVAIIYNSYNICINTGVTLGQIFAGGSSTTIDINITTGTTTTTIGSIALQSNGGYVLLHINFELINSILGTTIFSGESITLKTRIVVIDTNDSACIYTTFSGAVDMYAFEPVAGFCVKELTLKKIYTYVSVTSLTDRNGSARNAGKFFSSTIDDGLQNQTVDYDYTSGNWTLKSGKHAQPINNGSASVGMCKLLLDESTRYTLSNGNFIASTSGNYVRYRLRLRGFICNEFRASDGNKLTNNYLFPQDTSIQKKAKLRLINRNSSFGDIHIKIGNQAQYVVANYDPTNHTGGIEVGADEGTYIWDKTNVVTSGHITYCDKIYGSSTANVDKCHSSMINLNRIGGTNTFTDVYIYVQRTAISSTPDSFYLELLYEFGPDEKGNSEYIIVSDQYNNTKITGNLNYWPF